MERTEIPRRILDGFRRRLLERQRSLFDGIDGVEADLRLVEESRQSELGERAQQDAMSRLLDCLEERERREAADVQRALVKIATGTFGLCETCRCAITDERLELDPGVRRCLECERAREREAAPTASRRETPSGRPLPPEYADLDDGELAEAVRERLRANGDPDLERIEVRCRSGLVRLSGEVPSDAQRQVALQLVGDGMGLEVLDRLRVAGLDREDTGPDRPGVDEILEEERIPAGRGMKPLESVRPTVPEDEGEPPETLPDTPVPEKE